MKGSKKRDHKRNVVKIRRKLPASQRWKVEGVKTSQMQRGKKSTRGGDEKGV